MSAPSSILHIDLESRSALDLKDTGVYPYALHRTTDIWLLRYTFDDEEEIPEWRPGQPCPDRIVDHVRRGGLIYAWNSMFERIMWKCILSRRYGWPEPKLVQWDDPMVWALAMSFPAQLAHCATALGLMLEKDLEGHRLMLRMARPRKIHPDGSIQWWDDEARIQRLSAYCARDVEVEREAASKLLPLSRKEREIWLLDQRINDRGVKIDLEFVAQARRIVERRIDKLNARARELTNGRVPAVSNVPAIGNWMRTMGVPTESLSKDAVTQLLKSNIPERVKEVLRLRQAASKSSTAKLAAMENVACADGRARGVLQYHKAGPGRWASTLIQLHNMPRGLKEHQKQYDDLCEAISTGDDDWLMLEFGEPMDAVSSALRGCLVPANGKVFAVRDFSAIESRVLAWTAGEQWKIKAYAEHDAGTGPDVYRTVYAKDFGIPVEQVDDWMRQIGKVKDLSMGYQGGVAAFVSMAANYNMNIAELAENAWPSLPEDVKEEAQRNLSTWGNAEALGLTNREWLACEGLKIVFRRGHPATQSLWKALEAASVNAVRYPGQTFRIASDEYAFQDIRYRVANGHLWCRLPSGRTICYPFPSVHEVTTPWGETRWQLRYMGLHATTKQWTRMASYGGHLCENNTQGIAACFLREAMRDAELELGIPIVLHVHDELVGEVPEADGPKALDLLGQVMRRQRPWAIGCPIASAGFLTRRYRKD